MKIGIIGAGNVGTGLGKKLAAQGHDVIVSFARTPEKLEAAARVIGETAHSATPAEAARHGDVVIIATPWGPTLDIVREVAPQLVRKVVWDTTNPLKADMSGLEVGTTTSGAEEIARVAPGALVVKAVSPFAEVLHSGSMEIGGQLPGVFVCGDAPEARAIILKLLRDIPAAGIDAGPLSLARYTEPLGMLLVQLAYMQGMGARIGATLIR